MTDLHIAARVLVATGAFAVEFTAAGMTPLRAEPAPSSSSPHPGVEVRSGSMPSCGTMGAAPPDIGPAPVTQPTSQPPARLIVYPPVAAQLAEGRVVLQYRVENLLIRPVFGSGALDVVPRLGHLHITIDPPSWRWLDASNEPVVVNGLAPGPHSILLELVDPAHRVIDKKLVSFVIPDRTQP